MQSLLRLYISSSIFSSIPRSAVAMASRNASTGNGFSTLGIKVAQPDLTVLVAGGDGDGYGIGLNHLLRAIRRNVNLTYAVMDNGVYGNTKGQTASPVT